MQENTLNELDKELFSVLRNLNTELKGEDLKNECLKANAIVNVASAILESKSIALEAYKLVAAGKMYQESLPGLLPNKK